MNVSPDGIAIQDRDVRIFRSLFESRVMTLQQLAAMFFDSSYEAAVKRIRRLRSAAFVIQRERDVSERAIQILGVRGYRHLMAGGHLSDYPKISLNAFERRNSVSRLTLPHELKVCEVKAAFTVAIRDRRDLQLVEFSTWPRLFSFDTRNARGTSTLLRPDGFVRIGGVDQDGRFEDTFYLEVDLSSEPPHRLAEKGSQYVQYYLSGGLAERFGAPCAEYWKFPFRVLMVFKTRERRNNVATALLLLPQPIREQVWLSTFEEVLLDPLGPIWVRPRDYQEVTEDTSFNVTTYRKRRWVTEPLRQELVETRVVKQRLFDSPAGL